MGVHTWEPPCSPTVPRLASLLGTWQHGWVRQGSTGRPWLLRHVLCTLASTPEQLSGWMCAASPPLQRRPLCNSWLGWSGMDTRSFGDPPMAPWLLPSPTHPVLAAAPSPGVSVRRSTNSGIERGSETQQCLPSTEGLPAPRRSWDTSQGRNK